VAETQNSVKTPTYDLFLLLDEEAPAEQRSKLLRDIERMIKKQGDLAELQNWGTQTLAYLIEHKPQADYHVFQFSGPPALLEALDHTLKISDAVVRFRTIRTPKGKQTGIPDSPQPTSVTQTTTAESES
jgi:small subunit ribosomal protein S6